MVKHADIVLEAGSNLPIGPIGWGVLAVSLLATVAWLVYVYR